ncbi:MAG: anaerobic sulfatase maturase [Acidobacteria bacterium]|nr:anaerobic sulfatase maturase [Acidobacteriota bacterium]
MVSASREFQVFAKPAGPICNLDCRYCYYLKKQNLYPKVASFRMPDSLLEEYIVQHIKASQGPAITFSWHGGEPTVLGLDYFRRIVALQRKHQPPGRRILNGVQTNGILLDEEWCRFFSVEGFGVGLSLDGPAEMHDRYRVTKGQEPTHKQTMRAFELLQRYKIPCDILCVVHDQNVRYPTQVYRFFKEIGGQYLGFLPLVEPMEDAEGGVSPRTAPAEVFGTFLCAIFDDWIRQDTNRLVVQIFEEASRPARGLEHSLCIFRETCGEIPVIEHNGDFFSCDHFVDAKHRLGNIRETPLVELLESPAQKAFGQAKRDTLPRYCQACEVRAMCNGGCPKDRFIQAPDGEEGLNYLCPGLKRFFSYSRPCLLKLASRSQAKLPPERVMRPAEATHVKRLAKTSRNDPCPCGSGRKYKKCCLSTSYL